MKKGKLYFVKLLPTYGDNNISYVLNVEDKKPANHRGWTNQLGQCYFNDPTRGAYYVQCNTLGTLDEFSIALTGN